MTDKRFIEQFEENVRLYPDKVILRDEHHSLTFRELDELSGRVYAYLKEKGIGREDVVMITMPRSIEIVAAIIGIWKAGAAVVIVVEQMPLARINYIYQDSKAVLDFNRQVWEEAISHKGITGWKLADDHDALFIAYTSGSEGNPKGVLFERGKMENFVSGWCRGTYNLFQRTDIAGLPFPLFGTMALIGIVNTLYTANALNLIPVHLLATPDLFVKYLVENKISVICLTSRYYMQNKIASPYLKMVIFAMEKVQNVFSKQITLVNAYGQTEGASVCLFDIDKAYANTPIGVPTEACKDVIILDDNDGHVKDGEPGELCYKNPYFRGYINDEEKTKTSFVNGYFRSGDIARINEDGNYVILGRKSDMIKINGNRIEPAEIEAAVKRVLGIDWAFAKGFVTPERSFIVVYYTADINIDYASAREQLLNILPTYMIPSYFVHLNEVPHLPNGKVDRQALKAPDIEQYRAPYVAPENELEERLCAEMTNILFSKSPLAPNEVYGERVPAGQERGLSVLDDFYLLGGDSLRTIELVTNLGIENLTVTDIYAARTPRAIAERWMQKMIAE